MDSGRIAEALNRGNNSEDESMQRLCFELCAIENFVHYVRVGTWSRKLFWVMDLGLIRIMRG